MRKKTIKKVTAAGSAKGELAIEEPSREVSRLLRRWKNTIGQLSSGLFPNRNHANLIERLSENVRQLSNRNALMVVAKFGNEDASAEALSRLAIDDVREIAQIPVPDESYPGFRLARERLESECPGDFEVQCLLAANGRPGALGKIKELFGKTEPVEAFLALARHHMGLQNTYLDAPGEPVARISIEAVERLMPMLNHEENEKSEFARETLEEIVIGGMARQSMLSMVALKALSQNPDLVKDERAALAIAINTFSEETRETMLAKLGHRMLAEAYERGIYRAVDYLERDFENISDEKALACLARSSPELRALAVRKLDVDSLGGLLSYPEARAKAVLRLDEIGEDFVREMPEGFGSGRFALEAAEFLEETENPLALHIIYRNHPNQEVSRRALARLEEMVERADDQARKDILRISFNPEARTRAVRGLGDVHELIYHFRESDYEPAREAALDRLEELIREDCDEPFEVADIILSSSNDRKALADALGRVLDILNGDEGEIAVRGRGVIRYYPDILPETALEIVDERADDIMEALLAIEASDSFMAAALTEKLKLALTDWLEECPMKRSKGGIVELSEYILGKRTPLN